MSPLSHLPGSIIIDDPSKVGEARRIAKGLARRLEFDETSLENVAIVATEAATNLLKFAPGGELIFREIGCDRTDGLEILSVDRGPGMADLERCLQNGFSTSGTLGGGLGAMVRLSSTFDIHSVPGTGTVSVCRFLGRPDRSTERASRVAPPIELGVVSLPISGEILNGDGWCVRSESGPVTDLLVVDGLGHGPQAAQAAREAIRIFLGRAATSSLEDLIRLTHEALRATRGAAMAVCRIDVRSGSLLFAGIGNISALIVNPGDDRRINLVSHNGTVGHAIRKIQEFRHPWNRGGLLIMHTDGLSTRWNLDRYPGLASRHPSIIAGVLFRDDRRPHDDATVLVALDTRSGD